jgi:hypothetical protein
MLGALVVATSAPGLAVTHGAAHLHAAEHEREHDPHLTVADESGHDAHAHPQTDAAVTSRSSTAQFFVVAIVAMTLGTEIPVAAAAPRAEPLDVPDGPPPDRATQPRAPPLG